MASPQKNKTRYTGRHDEHQTVDSNAVTHVGQALQDLGKLTRRLPTPRSRPRPPGRNGPPPSREQLTSLIDAMGNPQHPDHNRAVDELVAIGTPAVPALCECVGPDRPWLSAYRAAEALGRIGSGRATGALVQGLQHPHSNVRWSAVHALAQIGDLRAFIELRRVAHDDHGKTSWGESVAESAQSALDQMRSRSVWGQSLELIKTAVTTVLMILALVLAFSVIATLRSDLERIKNASPQDVAAIAANVRTPLPTETLTIEPLSTAVPDDPAPTSIPLPEPGSEITGTVLQAANVRPQPNVNNQPIGLLSQNEEIVFISRTPDGQWYRVRIASGSSDSVIDNPDGSGTGWLNRALVSDPGNDVPVEQLNSASPDSTTTDQ